MDPQTQNPSLNQSSSQVPAQSPVPAPQEAQAVEVSVLPQVVDAVQNGKNVLVTVGANPSVDELAGALGLTFLLGKLDKHATAVFSGKIPQAMEFLDPEKTFENTVDSLRDFIIALDKEKADKLRYKVEDDVVKIFITPYRTILSQKDLEFSQGDFNVDVVIALGVEKREALDKAIIAHGRILHDASVVTINAGNKKSALGSVDWNDPEASSVSEMLVALSDAFGSDLLDSQISTAFLTGIVAETNRFSNEKTSPKVMSLSAQLMAAGANQQLIATNLRQEGMISEPVRKKDADQPHDDDGEMVLDHKPEDLDKDDSKDQKTSKPTVSDSKKPQKETAPKKDSKGDSKEGSAESTEKTPKEQLEDTLAEAAKPVEEEASAPQQDQDPLSTSPEAEAKEDVPPEVSKPKVIEPLPSLPAEPVTPVVTDELPSITSLEPQVTEVQKPTFGGTLSATAATAQEDSEAQAEREAAVNNVALSHDSAPAATEALDEARLAVEEANFSQPFNPANQPLQAINATELPAAESDGTVDTSVSEMQSTATPVATPPADEPDPVQSFMQSHSDTSGDGTVPSLNAPTQATPVLPPLPGAPTDASGMPPLPPLPGAQDAGGSLPPLPPLPGQPGADPAAAFQPQINPGFMQDMPQSQNTWTQAGDDLASQQANKDAARQQKMDQMTQQYDTAVDRNRELQGLPPLNDPNGSGLPPLPPTM